MLKINIKLTNHIAINQKELAKIEAFDEEKLADFKTFCEKQLNFYNPKILELQRMGFSTWGTPQFINSFKALKTGWILPSGFMTELIEYLQREEISYQIIDERTLSPVNPPICHIVAKPEQTEVLSRIMPHDRAILEAKPGFGKTMAALLYFIARGQKTIVIVHTRSLLGQWQKRIQDYFELNKGDMGMIGEGKWQIGEKITIASYQTLLSRGITNIKKDFGLVIIDECHHVPAQTFTKIARGFSAHYYLGLSATPFRKDKLDKLMNFYIGPIIPSVENHGGGESAGELSLSENPIRDLVIPAKDTHLLIRQTKFYVENPSELEFVELGTKLVTDEGRNQLIINDVIEAIHEKGKCLVLSERVGHCEYLAAEIRRLLPTAKVALITGQIKKTDREQIITDIANDKYQVLIATGSIIGEGFDWPAIDHLFLTFPFSWKGKLIQYVGRAQRLHPDKKQAFVYDYIDDYVPMLKAMYRKRVAAYKELGIRPQAL